MRKGLKERLRFRILFVLAKASGALLLLWLFTGIEFTVKAWIERGVERSLLEIFAFIYLVFLGIQLLVIKFNRPHEE